MNKSRNMQPRKPALWHALLSFGVLIVVMSVGIAVVEVDPHIPMFIGVIFACCMALYLGNSWNSIEQMMIEGISKAMQSY